MSSTLLYIYDAYAPQLVGGPYEESDIHKLGIEGGPEPLFAALDALVKQGRTFRRCLWQTHGEAGKIFFATKKPPSGDFTSLTDIAKRVDSYFNSQQGITALTFTSSNRWVDGGYHRLFPEQTRMYFDGCNVAEGDEGWKFLEAAGKRFLHGGGVAFGWDSFGIQLWKGRTIHAWGDARGVFFGPRGQILGRTNNIRAENMSEGVKAIVRRFGYKI
jgi:hypothetical protein